MPGKDQHPRLTEKSEIYYSQSETYKFFAEAEDAAGKVTALLKPLVTGKDVLDLGCGNGKYIALLGGLARSYLAVDQSAGLLAQAKSVASRFPNAACVLSQAETLPFNDGSFDVVFSSWVLGTILDEDRRLKAVMESLRVLRSGGLALLIENDIGGEFESIRGRYPDDRATRVYNEWLEQVAGYAVQERFSTYFKFESLKIARRVFEIIWGKEAAGKVRSREIEQRIVVFAQRR